MKNINLHILTLNWNGLDKIKRLASTLDKAVENINSKSIVWQIRDNGSTDGSVEWLKNNIRLNNIEINPLFISHNRDNFSQGVNSLWKRSQEEKADYILLLNNDVEFTDSKSLPEMFSIFNDSKVGAVGARLLYQGTNRLQHAGVIFGPRYGNMPYHFRHKEISDSNAQKNRYFQAVTAACCLIRGTAMRDLDPNFRWSFEDIDLLLRIKQDGWKIAYCGKTNIFHEESASLKKNPVNKLFMSHNVKLFKKKWFGKYELDHEDYLKNPGYNEI